MLKEINAITESPNTVNSTKYYRMANKEGWLVVHIAKGKHQGQVQSRLGLNNTALL